MSTTPNGPMVEHFFGVRKVVGSILSRVIPKTLKVVLGASLLRMQHSKVRPGKYGQFTCS